MSKNEKLFDKLIILNLAISRKQTKTQYWLTNMHYVHSQK